MNKIIFNYLLKNFLKTFFVFVLVFYCFGVILNLFEEIEFFKNIDVNIFTPFILTSVFIPSMIIKILPFIIFLSSMWFMIKIRNNKDLLTLKVFGYSNFKILMTLAITSFFLGFLILVLSELLVRYSGFSNIHFFSYPLTPFILLPIIYFMLLKNFKSELNE